MPDESKSAPAPEPAPPAASTPAAPASPTAPEAAPAPAAAAPAATALGSATYEVIRTRLNTQGALLRERMAKLDARRQQVFGAVEFKLLQADRITTGHNCVPRDMIQLGAGKFLFGFNVQFGLKKEIELNDVFAIYQRDESAGTFKEAELDLLQDKQFVGDFKRLYNVYARAFFAKFSLIEGSLYMVFQIGAAVTDIAVFKWTTQGGQLRYVDCRSETEFRKVGFPPQYDFRWRTPDRQSFRYGDHPHVSIEDRLFVECVGGDLTIKVEDNTASGEGIYAEPVDDKFQKVDDAEIGYAILGHLILLRLRPYKETAARYFIFNEKQQSVVRVDSIGQSCARLPEEQGLIFPDGYYLATGELKQFESREREMLMERVVNSPNGEDSLYVFYNSEAGQYVLMPYRLIAQKVEERITCNGFSLFPNGQLLVFRADDEPQKHHQVQLRQTPFYQRGHEPPGQRDAYLFQVGNKDVVRCLAECTEVLTLIGKEQPYAALYGDLVKRCSTMLDSYSWLASEEAFQVDEALRQVREVADKAVDEFEKVRRLQREAVQRVKDVRARCEERFGLVRRASFKTLDDFVKNLAALRHLRGELITLKEVRYVELAPIENLEQTVATHTAELSKACVKFLLQPEALEPYRRQAAEHLAAVDKVTKVSDGRKIEKAASDAGAELEMLIEIVNSLRIDDATEATRIIDGITAIYATLNQVKAGLKKRLQALAASEGAAQFNAQMKLLSQSAASYLDLCTTPAKCDDYLNRLSVQLEELEGAFADFDEYTIQLSEKRTALYEAFEQTKLALVEQRNRKASALMTAAERILKVIQNRLAGCKSVEDIHTYMASDLMISKVRDLIGQLMALEDSVKADDLQGRLKSAQQDAVRQLKDRQELFKGGDGVIQLGKHRFNINTQPLDLTVVIRDDVPQLHLTSTKYFETITDEAFLATRDAWDQEVVSENAQVYRAEYLAWEFLKSLPNEADAGASPTPSGAAGDTAKAPPRKKKNAGTPENAAPVAGAEADPNAPATARPAPTIADVLAMSESQRLALLQEFMSARYSDGYTKGVHDFDGARIFQALLTTHTSLQLARFQPSARACAVVYWHRFCPEETRELWTAKLKGFSARNRLFAGHAEQRDYINALQALLAGFVEQTRLYSPDVAGAAGEYLFYELISGDTFVVSVEADRLARDFESHLATKGSEEEFKRARQSLAEHPVSEVELVRDWARGFLFSKPELGAYLDELVALLFCGPDLKRAVVRAGTSQELDNMKGSHPVLSGNHYRFDYLSFSEKLRRFEREVVPRFKAFHQRKQELLERERERLRLHEFKPKVLTSFVRNQLIDQVYLPLVGDNLAKQIGAAGDAKRTD